MTPKAADPPAPPAALYPLDANDTSAFFDGVGANADAARGHRGRLRLAAEGWEGTGPKRIRLCELEVEEACRPRRDPSFAWPPSPSSLRGYRSCNSSATRLSGSRSARICGRRWMARVISSSSAIAAAMRCVSLAIAPTCNTSVCPWYRDGTLQLTGLAVCLAILGRRHRCLCRTFDPARFADPRGRKGPSRKASAARGLSPQRE